jgi:Cytochrome c554 and c-prime
MATRRAGIEKGPMPTKPSQSTTWAHVAVILACFVALALAAMWLLHLATRPVIERPVRSAVESANPVRLITFDRPFPAEGRFVADPYVGSRVCAECHPAESAMHSRSGHANTLRPAGHAAISRQLDGMTQADPEISGVKWSYQFENDQLRIKRTSATQIQQWIADYAIGSGHHALTYVSVLDHKIPEVLEHRLSYYPRSGGRSELGLTPGHDARPAPPGLKPYGGELPPRIARECFRCHATQLAAGEDEDRFDENTMIPNVSCERCHGPAKSHVAAARRHASENELALAFGPDHYTSEALLKLCGSCHRLPAAGQAGRIKPGDPNLVRFQPVGITQSACYQKSAGSLSCVTCHDPHARASADRPGYDQVCLSCHATSIDRPKTESTVKPAPACPVSARSRCVECHMPRKNAGQGILFSDHWIRVPSKDAITRVADP